MKTKSFALRVRGYNHISHGQACQDAAIASSQIICSLAGNEGKAEIIAVADGHGGKDYVRSATGSHIAVQVALEKIREFIEAADEAELTERWEKMLLFLVSRIIADWNKQVKYHQETNPFTENELAQISSKARERYIHDSAASAYGTTLIAFAVTPQYSFGIQIGDGKCVAVDVNKDTSAERNEAWALPVDGKQFYQPIPWDDRCFLNETTSLCDENAIEEFRYCFLRDAPMAVFIGTDGVDGSFAHDEQLYKLYNTVLQAFAAGGEASFSSACDELQGYLPRLSAKGSGDDISLAAILDYDKMVEFLTKNVQLNDNEASKEGSVKKFGCDFPLLLTW